MNTRIDDKIKEIEKYLYELEDITPKNFKEYVDDFKTKAACEHYFEKIIEACEDLVFLLVKLKGIKLPEKEESIFDSLFEENIIDSELSKKFKEAKGMRNLISHEYGNVDDEIVFNSITKEIYEDVKHLIKYIRLFLK